MLRANIRITRMIKRDATVAEFFSFFLFFLYSIKWVGIFGKVWEGFIGPQITLKAAEKVLEGIGMISKGV